MTLRVTLQGMVDSEGYKAVDAMAQQTKRAAARGMYAQATLLWSQTEQVISRAAQGISFYNIMDKIPSKRSRALRQAAQQAAQTGNHTGGRARAWRLEGERVAMVTRLSLGRGPSSRSELGVGTQDQWFSQHYSSR